MRPIDEVHAAAAREATRRREDGELVFDAVREGSDLTIDPGSRVLDDVARVAPGQPSMHVVNRLGSGLE